MVTFRKGIMGIGPLPVVERIGTVAVEWKQQEPVYRTVMGWGTSSWLSESKTALQPSQRAATATRWGWLAGVGQRDAPGHPQDSQMKFGMAHHPLGNPQIPGVTSSTKFPAGSRK